MTYRTTVYWGVLINAAVIAMALHLPIEGKLVVIGLLFVEVVSLLMFWPVPSLAKPVFDGANFMGWDPRLCGEHRTVGPHRARCFDCQMWCYPNDPCIRCKHWEDE